ncbi:hypothetical protein ACPTGE_06710 [Pseudomonas aeruginosa]|uniref:hypothetical protein n=1 Tax=Pseudomonas aeruginosa TaxID=287 RepID=UPI003CC58F5B
MSSTQHQLIEQCATRLRGIVEALDNIHDSTPHRWSTDLDDVHSSAESLLALIKDQAPAQDAQGLAGAALAQPSLAHELDPLNLAPHAEAFNEAPAEVLKPEQAERPEVVAYRTIGRHEKHQHPHYALNYYKQNAEDQAAHWRERGCEVSEDELMTVAQHERIVKAWIERWKAYIELSAKIAAQRDAALARVEQQERTIAGMNEAHAKLAGLYEAAQAQHSVPEGLALIPVRETEAMHDAVMALLYKGVARTDTQKLLDAYIAAAPGNSVPQAWLDVQAERRRQITAEGWTPEHDDEHADGQMAQAAGCYALHAGGIGTDWPDGRQNGAALFWPWDKDSWKPTTPRRDLVKACALALAEIERLDRAGISQSPQPGATTASS